MFTLPNFNNFEHLLTYMYKTKTAGTEEVYSPLTGTAQKRGSLLNKTMSEHTILMGVLRHMRTTPGAYTCMNPASFMQRMKRCVLRVTILVSYMKFDVRDLVCC